MGAAEWFWPVVFLVASLNGAYTAWAVSLPAHAEWLYYMDVDLPANISTSNGPDDVQARLESAGYTVTQDWRFGTTALTASRPDEPDFRARLVGLGGAHGRVEVQVQCRTAYMRDDCPWGTEAVLRQHLAQVLEDAGLPVDARGAHYGDFDFATWREFGLAIVQWLLFKLSAFLIVIAAVAKDSDVDRQIRTAYFLA